MVVHNQTTEMLDAILNSIDEGIHAVNEDGITVYYNPVAAKLDGLNREEVIGKYVLDVFPSLNADTSTLLKVIQTGKALYHQQQSYTNVKGKNVVTVNTTLPIYVGGKLAGALEISKDMTQIKELSDKLIDLQAQIHLPHKKREERSSHSTLYEFRDIITDHPLMKGLIQLAERSAVTTSPIFVYGETGTGKELIVQSIHQRSPRRNKPFIAQNCAALPATLLESLLFGTTRGSFTGAENRPGLFELAHEGTLFLDEMNSMPLELQGKLLRVLEDGVIRRIGDTKEIPINVRVIAAANTDLEEAVRNGTFRADLYYRIHVVSLRIPPLRERLTDIPLLVQHFVSKLNERFGKHVNGATEEVLERFSQYAWPGNVRELEHVIEAVYNILDDNVISWDNVKFVWHGANKRIENKAEKHDSIRVNDALSWLQWKEEHTLTERLELVEQHLIKEAVEKCNGNVQQAAKRLGIPRQTLQYKLKKYN